MSEQRFTFTAEGMLPAEPLSRWRRLWRRLTRKPMPQPVRPPGTVPVMFEHVDRYGIRHQVYIPAARLTSDPESGSR